MWLTATLVQERSALNQMTMAIMLPTPTPEAMYDSTPDRKLKQMENTGAKCALSHGQRLAEALHKIRQSLRSEQCIFAQLHQVLVLKARLSPQLTSLRLLPVSSCRAAAAGPL